METIRKFFDSYGWQYEFDPQNATWRTGFRGDTSNFNILVHLTDNWLYFAINPFVNAPGDAPCSANLNHHMLRLNHAINMAKFSLDSEGDVVLTVELPTENLDYSEFADGLNALSYYADTYYVDILNLARNAEYEPSYPIEEDEDIEPPFAGKDDTDLELN